MAFSDWSTTAASNTNSATGVNFDDGQAPSTVNDSARELMAQLKSALGSGQISFPATQNPSADANTLDDYEEGTFTPALNFGGATTGITYTTQVGSYTKIGRQVVIVVFIALSSKGSAAGNATLTGLPFTAAVTTWTAEVKYVTMTSSYVNIIASLVNATTTIAFLGNTAAATSNATAVPDTAFSNTSIINFTLTYFTT